MKTPTSGEAGELPTPDRMAEEDAMKRYDVPSCPAPPPSDMGATPRSRSLFVALGEVVGKISGADSMEILRAFSAAELESIALERELTSTQQALAEARSRIKLLSAANGGLADECNYLSGESDRGSRLEHALESLATLRQQLAAMTAASDEQLRSNAQNWQTILDLRAERDRLQVELGAEREQRAHFARKLSEEITLTDSLRAQNAQLIAELQKSKQA